MHRGFQRPVVWVAQGEFDAFLGERAVEVPVQATYAALDVLIGLDVEGCAVRHTDPGGEEETEQYKAGQLLDFLGHAGALGTVVSGVISSLVNEIVPVRRVI